MSHLRSGLESKACVPELKKDSVNLLDSKLFVLYYKIYRMKKLKSMFSIQDNYPISDHVNRARVTFCRHNIVIGRVELFVQSFG